MAKKKTKTSNQIAEQKFLASYDASQYPHPSVSVDVALITAVDGMLKALVIQRDKQPAQGKWSLPGGFVGISESLEDAAGRVLKSKTGAKGIFLEQLFTFGRPNRDPRTRVITIAYYALVDPAKLEKVLRKDKLTQLVELVVPWDGEKGGDIGAVDPTGKNVTFAFDHAEILGLVIKRLRGKLNYAPIGFELLPDKFTLRQLQVIHETILGKKKNKDSFRRRLLASGLISATGEYEKSVGHRPAELYRFKRKAKSK